MIQSYIPTLISTELLIKLILSLSLFILSPILNIRNLLTPILSASTIKIVTDLELIQLPTPDAILTSPPIPTLIMSLTNDTYHIVVLLELEAKLNALLMSHIEAPSVMIVLLPSLDDGDPANNYSLLQHYLMKFIHFYHRSATFTFPNAYHCTNINSHKNCKTCV